MADWSTVAVALVSASAALSGVYLKGRQDSRAERRRAEREDAASLRAKLEEIFLEIDLFADQTNRNNLAYLLSVLRKQPMEAVTERPSISRIRALIALNFPECQPALDQFDEEDAKNIADFQARTKELSQIQEAGIIANQRRAYSVEKFTKAVRVVLGSIAKDLGLSVSKISGRRHS